MPAPVSHSSPEVPLRRVDTVEPVCQRRSREGPMLSAPNSRSLFLALVVGLASVAACTQPTPTPDRPPRPSDPTPLGPGCDAEPDSHCDNTISRVMVQMLRGSQLPIIEENKSELCRRLAVDLIGRIPTEQESIACESETPTQMADRFIAMPDYVLAQSRSWGERFYNADELWFNYAVEVDDLVQRLYRDQMTYGDFTTTLIVHPGFYSVFQGDDWASNVVRFALGRPARADEIAGMRALQRVWDGRRYCDGTVWFNAFVEGNRNNARDADGACSRTEWAVNYCRCRDGDGNSTCKSDVFGTLVDFGAEGCADPENRDSDINMLRVSDVAAGRAAICPGAPPLPSCADRAYGDNGVAGQLSRLGQIGGAQLTRLQSLGRVLAARPDYWEAAVDREMRRFFSWWQNGLRRPDFDIPEVRRLLSEELRRTGSIRQLQRTIVTSLLYIQPAEIRAERPADSPVWSYAPTRVLTGERWLDSVGTVTMGQATGVCDYRFVAANYDWERMVDHRLIMFPPPLNRFSEQYHEWAEQVGGCSTRGRSTQSSLSVVSAQHDIARRMCAYGTAVLPTDGVTGSAESVAAVATRLYRRTLGRAPSTDELATLTDEMAQCQAAGATGCTSVEVAHRWACLRLVDSAEFAIY